MKQDLQVTQGLLDLKAIKAFKVQQMATQGLQVTQDLLDTQDLQAQQGLRVNQEKQD